MESDSNKEAVVRPEVPTQSSPTDTSNWDNKVSVDPNGEHCIRTGDGD